MEPQELSRLKKSQKIIRSAPIFQKGKCSKHYPKPLNAFSNTFLVSELIPVANDQFVVFAYRRNNEIEDCKFYGYWGTMHSENLFSPIMELHYHPSHKGIHIRVPCRTNKDYTGRSLVQAPELNIVPNQAPDIRTDQGIRQLICIFCKTAGIELLDTCDPDQPDLFGQDNAKN